MTHIYLALLVILSLSCRERKKAYQAPEVFDTPMEPNVPPPTAHKVIENKKMAAPPASPKKELEPAAIAKKIHQESKMETALHHVPMASQRKGSIKKNISYKELLFHRGRTAAKKGHFDKAQEIFLSSCQQGFYPSCHKFAFYEQKKGNFQNAKRFYRLSCNQGILKSCNNLAYGSELSGNHEEAKDYYSRACLDHHAGSCNNLKRVIDKERLAH